MLDGVYLAYPIDQRGTTASLAYMFDQIEGMKKALVSERLAEWTFDPGDAFLVGGNPQSDSLARVNRAALNSADLVVAFLPSGVPSVGVPMEIDRARAQGKHVIVFAESNSYMLQSPGLTAVYKGYQEAAMSDALDLIANLESPQVVERYQEIRFKVDEGGSLPVRQHDDDAGFDLFVSRRTVIPLGEFVDVPCAVAVELPEHMWGLVTGRSSALRKHGLLVHSGIIDTGYRGELFAGAFAMQREVVLEQGDRVAQLIPMHNLARRSYAVPAETLTPSARGDRGFGSTG